MSDRIKTENLKLFKRIKEQQIYHTNVNHAHEFILNSAQDCKYVISENGSRFLELIQRNRFNGHCVFFAFICWAFVNTDML